MVFIGIDPGKSGAICCLADDGSLLGIIRNEATLHEAVDFLRTHAAGIHATALLESVHAMPKQGVTSSFKFGQSFGQLEGLLVGCGIPYEFVQPAKWQKALGCLSKGDKNVTKAKAYQLFPRVPKITHKEADAMLIAEFLRRSRTN